MNIEDLVNDAYGKGRFSRHPSLESRICHILRRHPGGLTLGIIMNRLRAVPKKDMAKALGELEKAGHISGSEVQGRRGAPTILIKLTDKGMAQHGNK